MSAYDRMKRKDSDLYVMKYTAYKNRQHTDVLQAPAPGTCRYDGAIADTVAHIERAQLTDPALWALFVEQFRVGNADDCNLGWRSEYWGKMMRGACFTYAYTQNEALYGVLEHTVRDLLTTQDAYGRITTYSFTKEFHGWDVWGRKYVLLGLQYFLEICRDHELAQAIVASMCAQADYMIEKIGNGEIGKLPITNTSEWWGGLNASSVMEPFVRLYNITGVQKYLDFAAGIIEAGGTSSFNIFEAAYEGVLYPFEYPVTKAYEMISNFEGILEYYRVTGDEKYRTMAENFARLVIDSDITVIGCAGTTHELFDHARVRQFDPRFDGIMQETCVTVTWMKFCWQLLCLTGDPKYADQIERSVYNALAGSVNVNGNNNPGLCRGQVFTFDSYSPLLNGVRGREIGGRQPLIPDTFWWGCCVAIGAAGTGLIPMTAVMSARDGAAVNLYLPGTYTQTFADGKTLTLRMETDYPVSDTVRIRVETDADTPVSVSVRIPSWSKRSTLCVNDDRTETVPGSYAVLTRVWTREDEIVLTLDMRTEILYARDIDPLADAASICHLALRRGPVMLARDSRLGEDIREAVTVTDQGGFAVIEATQASIPAQQAYRVQTEQGFITVVDYASAGQTWDPDLPITVWITTK